MVFIIVGTLVVSVLLGVLLLTQRDNKSGYTKTANSSSNDANVKVSKSYSKEEVALHNKRTDCWKIIKNKVYNVTSYVDEHPGGDSILVHAGYNSTEGFFWLLGHGVSKELMDDVMRVIEEFHAMPAEDKVRECSKDPSQSCKIYTSSETYETESFQGHTISQKTSV